MAMTTPTRVDLQTAADELGVHYQTAYRWVRSGRLPSQRVAGKYVVDRTDLNDLERSRAAPQLPAAPSPRRLDRSAARLSELLVEGDEGTARHLVRRLVDEGTPIPELIQSVLAPPLREIGERWHRGELSIWIEHRSSAIVERILGDIVPNPRGRRRGTAVVGAISGDLHSLPTTMAAVSLRSDQWHVHHLGADVPADQMVECCTDNDTDVAVISVTNPELADAAGRAAGLLRRAGTPTILGRPGRGLDDLIREARTATLAAAGHR